MAIQVTCPGCKKRFEVSDKFAGQEGPCPSPNCKTKIKIPAAGETVVVHAPEMYGPKGATGKAILKPITRKEIRFSPLVAGGIGLSILLVVGAAIAIRMSGSTLSSPLLLLGALILAPALSLAGYVVLRDNELEPFRGKELMIRMLPGTVVFPLLWILYFVVPGYLGLDQTGIEYTAIMIPITLAIGGFASYCALDLNYMSSAMHYGLYLVATAALCFVMNVDVVNIQTANPSPATPEAKLRVKNIVEPVDGQTRRKKKTVQPESQPSSQ
ncbi:MAG: hypothetical protein CMJ75_20005 [Planctomycetaceae bacterium]|nr:hypothetical protein [Planctomycetaceae bacterium]